ncbi:hypothetical protein PPROV_000509800 [Pycnococcus provasolii]|uniref:NADP-dependent oxidoreductase domain-containing protein n=1 Tax=Pycnococcus provasolii TaxID=41880 RepID=A0A830HLC7_9CHLO|nr:hypothetical protein PPROV_000509800 [Pycnococcus provasolii]
MMLRQKHHRPKSALYLGNHNASRSSPARIAVACVRFIATGLACSALIGLCAVAHRHHVTSASKTKWLVDRRTTVLKPNMPWLIYGTAWKQAETYSLVRRALQPGKFQGIDTANQRKHYREDAVGRAVQSLPATKTAVYLQSKYTPMNGHARGTEPYDETASAEERVKASFWSTMAHLGLAEEEQGNDASNWRGRPLDAYLIHGLTEWKVPLSDEDWRIYRAMEDLYQSGYVLRIGLSNVLPQHVLELCEKAVVKPHVVQNRCYATTRFDEEMRNMLASDVCKHDDGTAPTYQAFSLLTANSRILKHETMQPIAARRGETPAATLIAFARQLGMVTLTGSRDEAHWNADLRAVQRIDDGDLLSDDDVQAILTAATDERV